MPDSLREALGDRLSSLARFLGADRATRLTMALRVWQTLAGVVTLALVAECLSPTVQGYFFAFRSLAALQSFLELGMSIVIVNLASHEWAQLSLDAEGSITGDAPSRSRLISLGRFIAGWYVVMSAAFFLVVSLGGYALFTQESSSSVDWKLPWVFLVLFSSILLWGLSFNSLLEGCDQVAELSRVRLIQTVLGYLVLWVLLVMRLDLWSLVALTAIKALGDVYLFAVLYRRFLQPFWSRPPGPSMDWNRDIWPMQWKLALSSFASYFSSHIFSVILFHYRGPVIAGTMGLTWSILLIIRSLGIAWIQPRVPKYGVMIARKEFEKLDRQWFRDTMVSTGIVFLLTSFVLSAFLVLDRMDHPLAQRVLPPVPLALFCVATVLMQVSICQSTYLRAHREEPIFVLGLCCGLAIGLLAWRTAIVYGALGVAASNLGVVLVFLLLQTRILYRCRRDWHADSR